jgi:hypothetical protein
MKDAFSKWVLGIAAVASVAYGGWVGTQITGISRSLGNLEGRVQCIR